MSYLSPAEFVTKMVDTGEAKIHVHARHLDPRPSWPAPSWRWRRFAVSASVMSGSALIGALLFRWRIAYLLAF